MQREPKHQTIAALDGGTEVDRSAEPVTQAEVPRGSLRLVVLQWLVLVVVALTLDLEREGRPRRVVLHAGEERRRATKPSVVAWDATLTEIGWTGIEFRAYDTEGIAQV